MVETEVLSHQQLKDLVVRKEITAVENAGSGQTGKEKRLEFATCIIAVLTRV